LAAAGAGLDSGCVCRYADDTTAPATAPVLAARALLGKTGGLGVTAAMRAARASDAVVSVGRMMEEKAGEEEEDESGREMRV
jgi:hypothetical protein